MYGLKTMEFSHENISKLFSKLPTLSQSQIYKHLTHIRLKACNSEGVLAISNSNNALEILINLLNGRNGRLIDVTLSILGFCCLKDMDVITKVSSLDIAKPLTAVFTNMKRDCIVGRACRLVGNMCQSNIVRKDLLEEGVAKHLVEVLSNTCHSYSSDTIIMAMRACRLLWKADIECELINSELIKSLVHYLDVTKHKDLKLVESALKTMLEITEQPSDVCLTEITLNPVSKCLVDLIQVEKFQDSAMKCIENLSRTDNRKMRAELGNAGLITLFINKLNEDLSHDVISPLSSRQILLLCKLSTESVNRAKIRREGGLPLFMKILKDKKMYSMLLPTLRSYLYDDLSLQELLSDGLVDVLIDVVIAHVSKHGKTHSIKPVFTGGDTRIFCSYYPGSENALYYLWDDNSEEKNVLSSTFGVGSPDKDVDICDSDNGENALESEENRSVRHLDDQVICALLLLSRISQLNQFVEKMATRKTFVSILNYLTLADKPHSYAFDILTNLLEQHYYLLPLIKQRFIFEVQIKLAEVPHKSCYRCEKLLSMARSLFLAFSEMAETGYGHGEITYQFLKSHVDIKRMLAVSLPFIIKHNKAMMKKILVESSGLDFLITALKDVEQKSDVVSYCSAVSVAHLSSILKIPAPELKQMKCSQSVCPLTKEELEIINSSNSVCFVLDDGTEVKTPKLPLVKHSPMFNAMFLGSFRESNADTIPLPGLSASVLNHTLKYIEKRNHNVFKNVGILETLDVLKTLDQFLLLGVESLMSLIVSTKLTHTTVVPMYFYSAELSSLPRFESLRECALNYMLTTRMTPQKRRSIFITAMKSPHAEMFANDVRNIFLSELNKIKF